MITAVSYCFKYASISFKSLRIVFSEHAKRLDKSCMTNGLASSVNRIRNNSLCLLFINHMHLLHFSYLTITCSLSKMPGQCFIKRSRKSNFPSFGTGTALTRPIENICGYSPHLKDLLLLILVVDMNCDIRAGLFSAADRCFPRARLQPPRETHSAGSSDTCCSRRSQRSSAPNNHHKSK